MDEHLRLNAGEDFFVMFVNDEHIDLSVNFFKACKEFIKNK